MDISTVVSVALYSHTLLFVNSFLFLDVPIFCIVIVQLEIMKVELM